MDRQLAHAEKYILAVQDACQDLLLQQTKLEQLVYELSELRRIRVGEYRHGRVFVLGLGGSAANASHLAADLRKLCDIDAWAPTDNVAELTARINDEGWEDVFVDWLKTSEFCIFDALFILSVGGGHMQKGVSIPLVRAIDYARSMRMDVGPAVYGIVGRNDGHTAQWGDIVIVIGENAGLLLTPIAEAFQAVVWHMLVSHPLLQKRPTKW